MKNIIKTAARLFTIILISANFSFAQEPPPPNGGINPGGGNTPVGGGAPIGSGLLVLISLGAVYAGKKVWDYTKRNLAEQGQEQ